MQEEKKENKKVVIDNSITPTPPKKTTTQKKALTKPVNSSFKSKYFEFYDDVKTHNNGPYDW